MHNGRDIKQDERLIDVRLKADSEVAPCPDQRKPLGSAESACLAVLKASYGWTLNMPFGMPLAVACRAAQHEGGQGGLTPRTRVRIYPPACSYGR
jgi:hypothetical protein